jgi:hypothetical protein
MAFGWGIGRKASECAKAEGRRGVAKGICKVDRVLGLNKMKPETALTIAFVSRCLQGCDRRKSTLSDLGAQGFFINLLILCTALNYTKRYFRRTKEA